MPLSVKPRKMREGCNDDHPSFASSCIMYNNNNNGYIGYRVYRNFVQQKNGEHP